jgi:outer membrane receptor protein involved in Fe transport
MAAFTLIALLCGLAFAQETTGSISGQVTDPSGAAVVGAAVTISGGALPRPAQLKTDATGSFFAQQVPIGNYLVTVAAAGFTTVKKTDTPVVMGKTSRVDFKLEVGKVTESVVVAADAVMVDTTSSSSAVAVDKSFFDILPKGRGFTDLVNLAPGARSESKGGGYQVDGSSGSENTFYLDGMEVTNVQTGEMSSQNKVPVEMVQQVQVKNGVMDAQYGGAMGGVVNAVVRSGSNEIHGEAGLYFNNSNMQARPRPTLILDLYDESENTKAYSQNALTTYKTWNPVFNIGAPILKNKLFWFGGYAPTTTNYEREVTFNENGKTGTYKQDNKTHYLVNKLDFAPLAKLRMNMSWVWNPTYYKGALPASDGSSSYSRDWAGIGEYQASNILSGQADYLASSKLVLTFRGGYHRSNDTTRYAISNTTFIYSTGNTVFGLPAEITRSSTGWVSQGVSLQDYNIYSRVNLNAEGSYLANWKGQHNLKFGWQTNRLSNSVQNLTYPTGYYRYYWNSSYSCVTSQCSGKQRGTYGFYRYYEYGDMGDASSTNTGLFLQDSWRVNQRLTLNIGIRAEREYLPSFAQGTREASPPIEFGFGSKVSPRIGASYDIKGDGKQRIYASFGMFYDVMKYEMPRGSFGGALYKTYYYSLDDPYLIKTNQGKAANPLKLPGKLFEAIDWRIPSNSVDDNTVDPDLKPMKQRMFDLGYDYSFSPTLVGSVRYTNRRLVRTIEDIGTLTAAGEVYYIGNPGEGLVANPKTWAAGYPTTPKAVRNYDALEFRLDKRFARNYQFAASYTWSRLYGNYSGLASSDEITNGTGAGRSSPNVNRYFDVPWLGYTEKGALAEGRLGTDRPNTFKFFGGYTLKSILGATTLSPSFSLFSGTPSTTEVNAISTTPTYPYGRGDMGRTPVYYNIDANLMHEVAPFKNHEAMKFRFEFSVFNLFNSSIVTNYWTQMVHSTDSQIMFDNDTDIFKGFNAKNLIQSQFGRTDPRYGFANAFQSQRQARLQVSFFF